MKEIFSLIGLIAGVILVIIADYHTWPGAMALVIGLILTGAMMYTILMRRREKRLATEKQNAVQND